MSLEVIQSEVISMCSEVGCAQFDLPPTNRMGAGDAPMTPVFHENVTKYQRLRGLEKHIYGHVSFHLKENKMVCYLYTLYFSQLNQLQIYSITIL